MESVRDGLAKVCFTIVMRNQASVGGSSCSISSLKFALSHQEQAAVFSLPCLDKTSGCGQNTSYASKLSAPHSQDSRLLPPGTPDTQPNLQDERVTAQRPFSASSSLHPSDAWYLRFSCDKTLLVARSEQPPCRIASTRVQQPQVPAPRHHHPAMPIVASISPQTPAVSEPYIRFYLPQPQSPKAMFSSSDISVCLALARRPFRATVIPMSPYATSMSKSKSGIISRCSSNR